jgi:hypothetical protein
MEKMMKRRMIVVCVVTLCLAVGTLCLAADQTVGTWKVNVAKSKYSPGPSPKVSMVKFEETGDNVKIVVDATEADGKASHNEWTGKYDGKDYAVKGDLNTDARSYKKTDDYTLEVVSKKAGKVTTTSKSVYSQDGKTRTLTTTGTNAQGQKVDNSVIYEKQ